MLHWSWNRIRLALPPDWEMLQFARDPDRGRCAFADRYRYRFELNWSEVPGEPDFQRMLSDYASRLEQDGKMTGIQNARIAGWHGLTGQGSTGNVSRFGKWLPDSKRLIETVFLWPEQRNSDLEKAVLPTISEQPVDGKWTEWRAFGMQIKVPLEFTLDVCTVQAASAGMLFRDPKRRWKWIFRRYGLVDSWMKGSLEDWARRQLPEEIRKPELSRRSRGGLDLVAISGIHKPQNILNKNDVFYAAAWRCQADGRLYHVMLMAEAGSELASEIAAPEDFLVPAPEFSVGQHAGSGTVSR